MRIDVELATHSVEAELERVVARLHAAGRPLRGLATLDLRLANFVVRHREADGEHYVYVEDAATGRLAGYTVFNRLIELDRRADRVLRSPHSKYGRLYQRRGLASAVYRWALGQGISLLSGPRQSTGANALWHSLSRGHPLEYVSLKDKVLSRLGPDPGSDRLEDFHTRMMLLGAGWTFSSIVAGRPSHSDCPQARRITSGVPQSPEATET